MIIFIHQCGRYGKYGSVSVVTLRCVRARAFFYECSPGGKTAYSFTFII